MNYKQLKQALLETKQRQPIRLDKCTILNDHEKFVQSHISYLDNNSGNPAYLPYYQRLVKYYELIKKQNGKAI